MNNKCNYFVTISLLCSEISLKSHEKPGNLLEFACITFAQYCNYHNYVCLLPRLRANYQMEALMTGNLSALLTLSQVAKQ